MRRSCVLKTLLVGITLLVGAVCVPLIAPSATAAAPAASEPNPAEQIADPIDAPTTKPTPVLVISSYRTSPARLLVGSRFRLTLDIRNATPRRADNVVVALGNTGSGAPAESGGSGLTVLGTGNAKHLGALRSTRTESISFDVMASPTTPPGAMSVPVTISFEYDGGRHELQYTIGLVFERNAVLAVTLADIPKTALVKEPFEASFELANSSTFELPGASISVEASGASVADGQIFVGTFGAGTTESIDVSITPEKGGPLEVKLVAKYLDDFGRIKTFESTYTVEVEGQLETPDDLGTGNSEETKPQENWFIKLLKSLFGIGS